MAVSIKVSKQGLQIVDKARKKKGWTATASAWCDAAKISVSTLKRFREGQSIRQDALINICKAVGIENWQEIVAQESQEVQEKEIEFFAYDDKWVGREALLTTLKKQIKNKCRLLIITGITGIGKTALAERLTIELSSDWNKFITIIPENFDNYTQPTDFASVAARWLEEMGEQISADDRQNHQFLLETLLNCLFNNQYLILMDSLEEILEGNQEQGWNNFQDEWWVNFFVGLLKANSCQSLIIVTSQDLPIQIQTIGSKSQNWYFQNLTGLSQSEQLDLFAKIGLEVAANDEETNYLTRIGTAYEGHTLALKVIGGEIGNHPFYGNISAYWHKYGEEIEKVEKAISESKNQIASKDDDFKIHNYNRLLQRNVEIRLERTLERLKKDIKAAYILLCEASIYRRGVPEKYWLRHLEFWPFAQKEKEVALDVLRDRYLVEELINPENNQCLVRQHNLIRSIALAHFKNLPQENGN
jgi:hypothetical protein